MIVSIMIKTNKNKIVIRIRNIIGKQQPKHGHEFILAHGKNFKDAKVFTVEVKHQTKLEMQMVVGHLLKSNNLTLLS